MAARADEILFEYVAHIQKENGHTMELCGTRQDRTINDVYVWLCSRACELKGYLISQIIYPAKQGGPVPEKKEVIAVPKPKPQVPAAFSDRTAFGVYTTPYKGASLCTYKVTED